MLDYQYAYLLGSILFLPVWLFLYFRRKDLRKKMIVMSFLLGFVGPLTESFFIKDYWRPFTITNTSIGIEDYIFVFLFSGIACVLYEEIFGKKLSSRKNRNHHWALFFAFLAGISFLSFFFFLLYVGINSIYASFISCIILGISFLIFRKDLWIDAIASGFLCGGLFLVFYVLFIQIYPDLFQRMWLLHNLSGYFIYKVPIEEILWAFGVGFIVGPMYEFYAGLTVKKLSKR